MVVFRNSHENSAYVSVVRSFVVVSKLLKLET